MIDEASTRPAGAPDRRGHPRGGASEQSPLQSRAAFIKNRSWESVVGYNRGACARGGAQHGPNSESFETTREKWEAWQCCESTLLETLEFLKDCHRSAPFLFFNGNTFADIARGIADLIFAELPPPRRRELVSAVAHYVAGVLDRESMAAIVDELCRSATLEVGDHVKTLRGSLRGVITRVLEDGRLEWKPENGNSALIALPESLLLDDKPPKV